MQYTVKILDVKQENYNTKIIRTSKPEGFSFIPGHSIMIHLPGQDTREKRAFTFTSTNDQLFLEFIVKKCEEPSITQKIHNLEVGNEIVLSDMFGSVRYTRPGTFIASGIAICPFLAIFRELHKQKALNGNKLIYTSRTSKDIIAEKELRNMLGENAIFILTRENNPDYINKRINKDFLKEHIKDFNQEFYIAGSWEFMQQVKEMISNLRENYLR